MRGKWLFLAPLALVGFAVFVFLGGEIVRLLWNWLLPNLFGWPKIGFWQALGLLVLCRILFGGLNLRSSPGSRTRDRIRARWGSMTPEERARFRQRMRERWGFAPPAGGDPGAETSL